MTIFRFSARAALVLAAAWLAGTLAVRAADVFDFIPAGGRTLLAKVLSTRAPEPEVRAIVGAKRTQGEWVAYLREHGKALPGVQGLKDKELQTLADYMSFNLPLPAARIPPNLAQANWPRVLPMDGRDMVLDYCQGCHIVTVVVTQDKVRTGWLGTMHKPSHIEIKLTEPQREALANYLVLNANIPIDDVPEDLRAGGATY